MDKMFILLMNQTHMIQDSCISIDSITTAIAVKLGTTTDKSKIY